MRRTNLPFFCLLSAIAAVSYTIPWLLGWTQPNLFTVVVGIVFAFVWPWFYVVKIWRRY